MTGTNTTLAQLVRDALALQAGGTRRYAVLLDDGQPCTVEVARPGPGNVGTDGAENHTDAVGADGSQRSVLRLTITRP